MPEVLIPIGPQHPALKEPVSFRVFAEGELIKRLELDISYNHRGIEKAAPATTATAAATAASRPSRPR